MLHRMASCVETRLHRLTGVVLDEQVLLDRQRGEGDHFVALGQLLLRLIQREQQHLLQNLGDLGNFVILIFNNAICHCRILSILYNAKATPPHAFHDASSVAWLSTRDIVVATNR